MKRLLGGLVVAAWLAGQGSPARADEKDATPILDKAIKALGGEERLARAANASWKTKGTITFNDTENPITGKTTVQGVDRYRAEFAMEFNGNAVKGVTVLDGKKGWRKFGDDAQDLDDGMIASEQHRAYLQAIATTILPLKGKGFKVEAAPEAKVGDNPAAVVKGTGPDGKGFTIYFDKETGLPLKLTATVKGFQGEDFTQDTTYGDYKDFDGLKRATRVESKRDGNPFVKLEVTEFKALDKHDADTFAEPK
jgi:hypothetical protein